MENNNKHLMIDLEQQANQIFQSYQYKQNGIKPCSYFWKQILSAKDAPKILVPDTLIINLKQHPILWVYTNSQGKIQGNTNVSLKDYVNKVTTYCSPNQLTAVIKRLVCKEGDNNFGNDLKLVNSRYLHNLSIQNLGDQIACIQKYVKSKGQRAYICRTVYTKNNSYCFLITNRSNFYDENIPQNKKYLICYSKNPYEQKRSDIVKSSTGKNLKQTLPYLKEIVKFLRFQKGIQMTELVGDFVKDQAQNWWLVNIKAFKYDVKIYKKPKIQNFMSTKVLVDEAQKYQRTRQCKYCQKSYLQSQLTRKMTRKMLIQMDRYLLHMGLNYNWLSRSDQSIDSHCLYQQSKVCERCYRLYIQIQGLLSFEGIFLKKLGINNEIDPKDVLMRLTNKQDLQVQSKNKQILNLKDQIPQQISLGPNSSIITRSGCPIRNDQAIHQMVRYRFIIYLHQIDQLTEIKQSTNYYLQFGIFGSKFKIKLDLRPGMKIAPVRKLRLSYFFMPTGKDTQNLNQYINNMKYLKLILITQNRLTGQKKQIGHLDLDLHQNLSQNNKRKNFYKFFDAEGGFGWGLEGCIGLIGTQKQVNTSRLILTSQDKLIYLPNQHYYLCQPLPQDWLDQIQRKCKNKKVFQSFNITNGKDRISIQRKKKPLKDSPTSESNFYQEKSLNPNEKQYTSQINSELLKQITSYQRNTLKIK